MVLKNILLQEKGLDNTKTLCGSPDTLWFSETTHIFDGLFSCSKLLLVVVLLYSILRGGLSQRGRKVLSFRKYFIDIRKHFYIIAGKNPIFQKKNDPKEHIV